MYFTPTPVPTIYVVTPFLIIAYLLAPAWWDMTKRLWRKMKLVKKKKRTPQTHSEDPSTALERAAANCGGNTEESWTLVASSPEHPLHRHQDTLQAPTTKPTPTPFPQPLQTCFLTLAALISFHRFFWYEKSDFVCSLSDRHWRRIAHAYSILTDQRDPLLERPTAYDTWHQEQAIVATLDHFNSGVVFVWSCCILYMLFHLCRALVSKAENADGDCDGEENTSSVTAHVATSRSHVRRTLIERMKPLRGHLLLFSWPLVNLLIAQVTIYKFHSQLAKFHRAVLGYVLIGYLCYLVATIAVIFFSTLRSNEDHVRVLRRDLRLRVTSVVSAPEFRERLWMSVVLFLLFFVRRAIADWYRFNPYDILQVSPRAGIKDIKRAYRNLSYHRCNWD